MLLPVPEITEETLQMAKSAFGNPDAQDPNARPLRKTWDTSLGIVGVNLEAPSKKLFPVYSPLRNKIARVRAANGATATQWRAVTKINKTHIWPGVSEGNRNSKVVTETESLSATFKELGLDDDVTFKAINRSRNFEDIRATASINLLYANMIDEELVLLGGNTLDIGAPVSTGLTFLADSAAAGSLIATNDIQITVTALVLRGFDKAEKAAAAPGANEADGETTGLTDHKVLGAGKTALDLSWVAEKGAVAYNIFTRDLTAAGAGVGLYHSTVTVNRVTVKTLGAGAAPNLVDSTGNDLEFDGFISQIEKASALPATQFVDQKGAVLTSDSSGGITEFDAVLKSMWDRFRLGPDEILCNSEQSRDITKIIGGSSNLAYRIVLQDGQRNVVGGLYVGSYLNKFASSFADGIPNEVPIKIHPNLPAGTILFVVHRLPYPNNQVPNVWEVETLLEYTHYDWALTARKYEFGIYFDEVLKGYFPASQAAIVCVGSTT